MQISIEEIKVELQAQLDNYLKDNSSAKDYFLSMKEIKEWLVEEIDR